MFLISKNYDIQQKTVQVIIKICGVNSKLVKNCDIKCAVDLCEFLTRIALNLNWSDLLEVDLVECDDGRKVQKDKTQNHRAIVHNLTCGLAEENEILAEFLMDILVKYCEKNKSSRGNGFPKKLITKQHIGNLIALFLQRNSKISE